MKQFILSMFAFLSTIISFAQVGIGTTTPDASALLELSGNNKGFLPPRVQLTATNIAAPISNPAPGLLVFNTATSGGTPTNVSPGYYYWNGSSWYPIVNKGNVSGDMQYWNGTRWIMIPLGLNGQMLTICNGIPVWGQCGTTLTLKPANNPYEAFVDSYYPNGWNNIDTQLDMAAWTANGQSLAQRTFIKFDYSGIPTGAVIDSAKLYLFAMPNPHGGNGIDAHFGSSNACYINRITSNWTLASNFTWSNPPAISMTNQLVIPQSNSAFENSVIDVTLLVKDMQTNGNNGFAIKLQSETIYNIRQYVSSHNADATKHPALVVSYH
ncbi:MAG: domain containing protein [Ferruginibacter sp.]|nr:domain containing protein [Ferruginibacter sp.]